MTLVHLVVIALVQGITEFLPISSSGHLVLIPKFAAWEDQGLVVDVAAHFGTLIAVIVYLWRDILRTLTGGIRDGGIRQNQGFNVIIATLPILLVGMLVYRFAGDTLRSPAIVGWATIGFGVLLYVSDKFTVTINRLEHMTWCKAFIIGLAQIFALIPGASRAGTTITMARWLGFERADAARFSMLLSIPAILAASAVATIEILESGDAYLYFTEAIIAASIAFVTALTAITFMMAWLKRASFTPFVIYRIILGIAILTWVYY